MDHAITACLFLVLVMLFVLKQKDVALLECLLDDFWLFTLDFLRRVTNLIHYHQV